MFRVGNAPPPRLRTEPSARVLDVGCGTGWAGIAMAQAYPNINVDGVDLDRDAISAARRNAERAGVADRVRFSVTDAADLGGAGGYNLVTIFEALHEMSRPVDPTQSSPADALRRRNPARGRWAGRR
jgi:cyclopropane fatty-acyl-phospholipid synthase-like methyltransferase